ncbi:transglutaminaseTgpA domain-containing protein [bacterium]|nr:transglutaminaseTgpA domain-containing protein [bacterium]
MKIFRKIIGSLEKYGEYSKIPIFSLISVIPFAFLFEESNLFWAFYITLFLMVIFRKKVFQDVFVLFCFVIGLVVSFIHWKYISQIDLLFFGRLLLFLLLGLCACKIDKERAFVICFLDFVVVLVAGALTYKFWYAIFLLNFLLAIIYLSLEIQYLEFKSKIQTRVRFNYSIKLAGFLIVCGFTLFFLFPRGAFGKVPNELGLSVSGFSEEMSYQEMTKLLQSKKVVMRVISKNPAGYYQGIILDHFDGKSWTNTFTDSTRTFNTSRDHFRLPFGRESKDTTLYQFKVLPTREKTIFLPPFARKISIDPPTVRMDRVGNIKRVNTHTKSLIYEVESENLKLSSSYLSSPLIIPKKIERVYLQLPKVSDKLKKLASHLTQGKKNNFEKTQAIMSFFQRGFVYSLSSMHPGNPIENFLLTNRKGHCQYFAGAMVLLLRLNNIPARVVNGYSEGTYNAYGDYFTIRQSDAHAWVEVYGQDRWIIVDPTPAAIPGWIGWQVANNFMDEFSKILEVFDSSWQTYILYFSQIDQSLFLQRLKNYFKYAPSLFTAMAVILFLIAIYLFRLFFKSFQWQRKYKSRYLKKLDSWFEKMKYPRLMNIGILEHIQKSDFNEKQKKLLFQIQNELYLESFSETRQSTLPKSFGKLFHQLKLNSQIDKRLNP